MSNKIALSLIKPYLVFVDIDVEVKGKMIPRKDVNIKVTYRDESKLDMKLDQLNERLHNGDLEIKED